MNWISIEKCKPQTNVSCLFRYEADAETFVFIGYIDIHGCICPDNKDLPDYVIDGITHFAIISDFINLNL